MRDKIGILNDMKWNLDNKNIYTWTNISPERWKEELENKINGITKKIDIELINTNNDFDLYLSILNPYGGVYPERDIRKCETGKKIFDYVYKGGIFINVSEPPGYWAFNLTPYTAGGPKRRIGNFGTIFKEKFRLEYIEDPKTHRYIIKSDKPLFSIKYNTGKFLISNIIPDDGTIEHIIDFIVTNVV